MVGSQTCHNFALTSKDKLAERALNKDNNTLISISANSRDFILAFILILGLPNKYTDVDL